MSLADRITRLPLAHDPARGAAALALLPPQPGPVAALIAGAAGASPYLARLVGQERDWLARHLDRVPDPQALVAGLLSGLPALAPDALGVALRQAKARAALLAALADLGGVWPLDAVTGALTALADGAVDLAFRAHLAREAARGRIPAHDADAAGLIVLAMGKMGAGELNYSSDIDLIVLYDEDAYDPADRPAARAGLIRVTRAAAATLSDLTDRGYVFRTDLRLRPDASVTPVCVSAAAALAYYEAEGRTWERAAHIKSRPCAGNLDAGARFLRELRPFVWRRHLDFAAIEDAHAMRLRIRDHKGLHGAISAPGHDMKLGPGGIREIEFFTQTRQLISGGRDPSLRPRGTVPALAALAEAGWVAPEIAADLTEAYRRHRQVEHRIQMIDDTQTHRLPPGGAALDAVARLDGAPETAPWAEDITRRLIRVEALTDAFFAPGEVTARPALPPDQEALIEGWRTYPALRSPRARRIFRRIEPDLLARMQRAANPAEALARFDGFLNGMPAGVQLFTLFEANPQLIDLIVDICATAPRLAHYLSRHSGVLDAVIAGSFFSRWPGAPGLHAALAESLATALVAPDGGYERALDAARRFAHDWQFRIGVHHLRGLIGAEEAAGQYADLAHATVAALTDVAVAEFSRRHGPPPGRGAVVLGMGSLGARRLHASSDLDLIVIFDAGAAAASDGPRPLPARLYYTRLTQALITALSVPTAAGPLYQVDMRLRPSGRQGPVASALTAFRAYQFEEAWLWEHLALTRGRVQSWLGAEGAALADEVEALRVAVLAARGQDARVLPDLAAMRARIFAARASGNPWRVKTGPGRLQDIELLAQSLALRAAAPSRDVAGQLRAGRRAGLIAAADAEALAGAHRVLWQFQSARRLLTDQPFDMDHIGEGGRAFLLREAGVPDLPALAARLDAATATAAAIMARMVGTGENPP